MYVQLPSDMGNKPSVSEGEDDEDRAPLAVRVSVPTPSAPELTNGGGEEAEDEVELPPPMKPIQEPILVTTTAPVIEENPCKRVSYSLNNYIPTYIHFIIIDHT